MATIEQPKEIDDSTSNKESNEDEMGQPEEKETTESKTESSSPSDEAAKDDAKPPSPSNLSQNEEEKEEPKDPEQATTVNGHDENKAQSGDEEEEKDNVSLDETEATDECAHDPNFAVICSFLDKFGPACGIPCPSIQELEVTDA